MKIVRFALRSVNDGISHRFQRPQVVRTLSTDATSGGGRDDQQHVNSGESAQDFEHRIVGDSFDRNSGKESFLEKLDRLGRGRGSGSNFSRGSGSSLLDGLDESFNSLSDGMDGKLKKAATYFEFEPEEFDKDDYAFRPDMNFMPKMTYDIKDIDLTKPGVRKPAKRLEFEVTTEEVLRKADFRDLSSGKTIGSARESDGLYYFESANNVRFLANFITEAGIIIKRSKTGISAKAQRKIAREIKTARAFGLMPFTTMGTKSFGFGKNMEDLDEDFEFDSVNSINFVDA